MVAKIFVCCWNCFFRSVNYLSLTKRFNYFDGSNSFISFFYGIVCRPPYVERGGLIIAGISKSTDFTWPLIEYKLQNNRRRPF
jgi:hypothetical protein